MNSSKHLLSILFSRVLRTDRSRRTTLSVSVQDGFRELLPGDPQRERYPADRSELLAQALEAWQTNPLARRIVELTSQYVVGGGITLGSKHPDTDEFLRAWWNHPLNRMDVRCTEWCEELVRAGELFVLISTDASGMSYLRAVPAGQIGEIITAENDVEQELAFIQAAQGLADAQRWEAYHPGGDLPDGDFTPVMRHYAINRPVGALHGEPDLAPLLRWLSRYSGWLEDRVRLNRYRQAFLYQVKAAYNSEAERIMRQNTLNAAPPAPGSILVTDESETWSVIQPQLNAHEAAEDGLAIKRMIAAGAGIPLHFLAEPEGSTRTTAESAGGPTFRHFEQRQKFFLWMLEDLARIIVQRKALVCSKIDPQAPITVSGADISARDNASLAVASSTISGVFMELRSRGLVDDSELLRICYRFAGEVVDVEEMLKRGAAADETARAEGNPQPAKSALHPAGRPANIKLNPLTGELVGQQD
jgi:hypothetical protein